MRKVFYNIIRVIVLLMFFGAFNSAYAAQVLFQPQTLASPQAENYTVSLVIDTADESINAVAGRVLIDKALGVPIEVTDSGSIISFWVEQPQVNENTNSIKFSGTIPGGFTGSAGVLFSLVMPSYDGPMIDNAIAVTELQVLRNDGLGSRSSVSTKSFAIGLTNEIRDAALEDRLYFEDRTDDIPPEIFSPQVARDDRVFDGKWFLNFATVDKQSGIDYYEVQESKSGSIQAGKWQRATSPYLLLDQDLQSYIYVTAVDRQGNERIIKIWPRNPVSAWPSWQWGLAGVVVLLLISSVYFYKRRSKKF